MNDHIEKNMNAYKEPACRQAKDDIVKMLWPMIGSVRKSDTANAKTVFFHFRQRVLLFPIAIAFPIAIMLLLTIPLAANSAPPPPPQNITVVQGDPIAKVNAAIFINHIHKVNVLLGPRFRFPTDITLILTQSRQSQSTEKDEIFLNIPSFSPRNEDLGLNQNLVAILVHEYGHLIFQKNLADNFPNLSQLTKKSQRALLVRKTKIASQLDSINRHLYELNKTLKQTDLSNEIRDSFRRKIGLLKWGARQLQREIQQMGVTYLFDPGDHFVTQPYSELFSDLMAIVYTGDPEAMTKAGLFTTPDPQQRRFERHDLRSATKQYRAHTWTEREVHRALSPARNYFYNEFLKGKIQAEQGFQMRILFSAILAELKEINDRDLYQLNPKLMNIRLIKKMQRQLQAESSLTNSGADEFLSFLFQVRKH